MNMHAMMKQAQKMQKDMMSEKSKIDETEFEGKSSFVTVKMNGGKKVLDVKINVEKVESDEIEMLQDMFVVAVNDCIGKIDKEVEMKMGKYTQGMPGLF